nr:hypothetical protein CFP56_44306 [Quercus suber]
MQLYRPWMSRSTASPDQPAASPTAFLDKISNRVPESQDESVGSSDPVEGGRPNSRDVQGTAILKADFVVDPLQCPRQTNSSRPTYGSTAIRLQHKPERETAVGKREGPAPLTAYPPRDVRLQSMISVSRCKMDPPWET